MDRASLTAELAALARASHTREPEAIRGPDDVAIRFVGPALRFVVRTEPLRRLVRNVLVRRLPGSYGYVIVRSEVFDGDVIGELEAGATQLVVLGAGYDSRAYRFAGLLREGGARVFEVDAPPTSAKKRQKVKRAFGSLPAHVTYVPVAFGRDDLRNAMLRAGYEPTARTVFSWEGVSFYLTERAVDDVFAFVRQFSGGGSAIVFDYVERGIVEGRAGSADARTTTAYLRRRGEPFTFGLEHDEVARFLQQRGFDLEEHLDAGAMAERHLGSYATSDVHHVASFYGIAKARVRSRTSSAAP